MCKNQYSFVGSTKLYAHEKIDDGQETASTSCRVAYDREISVVSDESQARLLDSRRSP